MNNNMDIRMMDDGRALYMVCSLKERLQNLKPGLLPLGNASGYVCHN
jgi:hypothetical protein